MAEIILEESEMLNGAKVQLVRLDDGTEVERVNYYTCSICGAKSDRPFPRSAISCFRSECKDK
jgi:hypothetical protein